MNAAKTQKKNLKEMPYPPPKKLLKKKGNSTRTSQIVPNFTNFFRTPKI